MLGKQDICSCFKLKALKGQMIATLGQNKGVEIVKKMLKQLNCQTSKSKQALAGLRGSQF